MTPRELIRITSDRFRRAGIPDPETDAALLLSHLTGRPHLELRLDLQAELLPETVDTFLALADKRLEHVPLQYLLGQAPFFRRVFAVDSRVLIPRPETELLCEWALEEISGMSGPRILDLCCGSGCIGLTLKAERSDASVTLSDISQDALDLAACNASRIAPEVSFRRLDLLEGFDTGSFDLIVSNPPYIPSAECLHLQPEVMMEPRLALDGGPDGCDLYRRIAVRSADVLVPGGKLMMELGIGQSKILLDFLSGLGYRNIEVRKDYSGIDRMILAENP